MSGLEILGAMGGVVVLILFLIWHKGRRMAQRRELLLNRYGTPTSITSSTSLNQRN